MKLYLVLVLLIPAHSIAYSLDEECVGPILKSYGELHSKWVKSSKYNSAKLHNHDKARAFCQCVNNRLIHEPNVNADKILIECSSKTRLFEEMDI